MAETLEVRAVGSRTDLDHFIRLPWRIYRNDPQWVPPLIGDVRRVLDRNRHPFHQHAEVEYFLAWRGNEVVGRIVATVNHAHNNFHEDQAGFFGFFESIDDQAVANALLQTAENWLRERGRESISGPFNFSTNDELYSGGVLIDGFDTPPAVMMAHTPQYYARLLERAGYSKAKDLLSYWVDGRKTPERLVRALERFSRNENINVRSLNVKDFDGEVARIKEIYNAAWERNWGFVPMTDAEFQDMANQLRPIIEPSLCQLAEINGEPVGFALQLPDLNQALRHVDGRLFPFGVFKFLWYKRKIQSVRVITLGVKPAYRKRGLDALLITHVYRVDQEMGRPQGECSWILEDNAEMRHGLDRLGGHVYKTYRVFQKQLSEQ